MFGSMLFPIGEHDPYWDYVVLLTGIQNVNNSTAIFDYKGHPLTVNGNLVSDTGNKLFNNASGKYDGNGDYWETSDSNDWFFSFGQFTLEGWIYPTVAARMAILAQWYNSFTTNGWNFEMMADRYIEFTWRNQTLDRWVIGTSQQVVLNAWNYVAVTKDASGLIKLWVNGIADATTAIETTELNNAAYALRSGYGSPIDPFYFQGNMGQVRITKGIARVISVPTTLFPNR